MAANAMDIIVARILEGTAPSLVVDVSIIVGTDIPAGEG